MDNIIELSDSESTISEISTSTISMSTPTSSKVKVPTIVQYAFRDYSSEKRNGTLVTSAICKHCGELVNAGTSLSNYTRHLRRKHEDAL